MRWIFIKNILSIFIYYMALLAFTYCISFLFDNESTAQNGTILFNFLIGTLFSSNAFMYRSQEDLKMGGKVMTYTYGFAPAFNIAYGYQFLLNSVLVFIADSDE